MFTCWGSGRSEGDLSPKTNQNIPSKPLCNKHLTAARPYTGDTTRRTARRTLVV